MLEVVGKQISGELRGPPHHKGRIILSPRDNVVSGWIVHKIVSLCQERSGHGPVTIVGQQAHRFRSIERERHSCYRATALSSSFFVQKFFSRIHAESMECPILRRS